MLMSIASPQSRDIAFEIARLGHELHVIDAVNLDAVSYVKSSDSYQQEDIRALGRVARSVHWVSYRGTWGTGVFGLAWRISQILSGACASVLLTIHGGTYSAAAYLSQFRPYAVYVGGSDVLFARYFKKQLSRLSLASASKVFANGRYLAAKTEELAPGAMVYPLYMGTDTSKFRPGDRPTSPILIVCTRGFLPIYNNELLIHALKHMPDDLPEYHVVFAAAGPELEKARALASEVLTPAQRSRVQFLAGVSRKTLAELLSKAHVYVSMSLSDGTSLSLMEAMACGAFPVLSDIPANQEWVEEDTNNALLVSCNSPPGLAKALARAIEDEALRSNAGAKNRQLILERADLKSNMETMVQELTRCTDVVR